jgi:hypothetical protein
MKKLQIIIGLFALVFSSSCIKNELPVFDEQTVVEFDAASWNANGPGLNYPILTRIPGYGRPIISTGTTPDPVITRNNPGIKRFRVNLVGPLNPNPIRVFFTTFAGTTAVENVHYRTLNGELTIPANSSFGEMEVEILNPGPPATPGPRDLNIILTGGDNGVTSSVNYRVISLRIAQ